MPTLTIKLKVVIAFVFATAAATLGLYFTSHASYERNVAALSRQSLDTARRTFEQLSTAEVAKMQSVVTSVAANQALTSKMSIGRREELLASTLPLFSQLKQDLGITNFNYIDPNENRILVVTDPRDPKLIGTRAVRFNIQEAARTKTWAAGLGLGFHGLALRVTHAIYDSGQLKGGNLVGYLELGVEINSFTSKLKAVTGNEFGLVIKKKYLNEEKWASSRAKVGLQNNWANQPDVVVASNTTSREDILRLAGDLAAIPNQGATLGIVTDGSKQYARSVFPVRDAAKEKIGAMFVLTDISHVKSELERTLARTIASSVAMVAVLMLLLISLLSRLVFRRLDAISRVATRVVGGDYETPIRVGIKDEIGRFEELLEQFRVVVVSLIADTMRMQNEIESSKKPPD